MKKWNQTIKGIKIGFPLMLLLLGYGCGDMSGTIGSDSGQKEDKIVLSPTLCYKNLCPAYYYYFPLPNGMPGFMPAPDTDGDGIPDNVETYLLEKYSPYFMFSTESNGRTEHFNPTDPIWYLEHSGFYGRSMATDPLLALELGYDITTNQKKVDDCIEPNTCHLGLTNYCCPSNDNVYGDPNLGWLTVPNGIEALGNVGLFGHVVPEWGIKAEIGANFAINLVSVLYYKIEYWQFFAWNDADQPLCVGNHQSDWTTVQLRYDPQADTIVDVHHYVHGKEIFYSMDSTTVRAIYNYPGWSYMEYRGLNYGKSFDEAGSDAQNNTLRMLQDSWDYHYIHPMVYIEYGAHEFWPTENGHVCQAGKCSPRHDGGAYRFLTHSIPNLGEVESTNVPSDEAKIVLRFNGYWGCHGSSNHPPPGPPLHKSWAWPPGSPLKIQLDNNKVSFE